MNIPLKRKQKTCWGVHSQTLSSTNHCSSLDSQLNTVSDCLKKDPWKSSLQLPLAHGPLSSVYVLQQCDLKLHTAAVLQGGDARAFLCVLSILWKGACQGGLLTRDRHLGWCVRNTSSSLRLQLFIQNYSIICVPYCYGHPANVLCAARPNNWERKSATRYFFCTHSLWPPCTWTHMETVSYVVK